MQKPQECGWDVFHNAVSILPPRLLIAISSANRDLSRPSLAQLGCSHLVSQQTENAPGIQLLGGCSWGGQTGESSRRCLSVEVVHGDLAVVGGTAGLDDLWGLFQAQKGHWWPELKPYPHPAPPGSIKQIKSLLGKGKQQTWNSCAAQLSGAISLCIPNNPWSCCLGNNLAIKGKYWYLIKLVNQPGMSFPYQEEPGCDFATEKWMLKTLVE